VRRASLAPANVSDKAPFLALVQGDERIADADRGYESRWFRERLAEQGIADGVMRCDFHRRRLTPAHGARNRAIAPLRAPVERTFATQALVCYRRVRCCSLLRNACSCPPAPRTCAAPWCWPADAASASPPSRSGGHTAPNPLPPPAPRASAGHPPLF
jgi:hypothetical protein